MSEVNNENNLQEIEIQNIVGLRSNMYGLLSRGYSKEIDETYINQIKKMLPVLKEFQNNFEDEMFSTGVNKLEKYVENIVDMKEEIEEQARRFATIFLNVSPNDMIKHVHPYASVYLSAEKLVMQEQRDEALEFYARFGLGVDKNFKEPEDHIAAELSFLSMLNDLILKDITEKKLKSAYDKLQGHKEFMEKHLLKWIHLMGTDLRKADENGFYGILADLTMGFVRIDYKFLREFIEYIKENI